MSEQDQGAAPAPEEPSAELAVREEARLGAGSPDTPGPDPAPVTGRARAHITGRK